MTTVTIIEIHEPHSINNPHPIDSICHGSTVTLDGHELGASVSLRSRFGYPSEIEVDGQRSWFPVEVWRSYPDGTRYIMAKDMGILHQKMSERLATPRECIPHKTPLKR
jgi:hypothetical protein